MFDAAALRAGDRLWVRPRLKPDTGRLWTGQSHLGEVEVLHVDVFEDADGKSIHQATLGGGQILQQLHIAPYLGRTLLLMTPMQVTWPSSRAKLEDEMQQYIQPDELEYAGSTWTKACVSAPKRDDSLLSLICPRSSTWQGLVTFSRQIPGCRAEVLQITAARRWLDNTYTHLCGIAVYDAEIGHVPR